MSTREELKLMIDELTVEISGCKCVKESIESHYESDEDVDFGDRQELYEYDVEIEYLESEKERLKKELESLPKVRKKISAKNK